jgi:Cytochrome c, mono- and diheme variants
MRSFVQIISIAILFLVGACHNQQQKLAPVEPQKSAEEVSKKATTEPAEKEHPGKAVYNRYCLTCHQTDGSGVPNMYPPLTPGSWVEKNSKELIAIMMKGLSGKIEVNGETYKNFMPSHAQLTDEQIADVLSYIRRSFGNNLDPVTAEMVKTARSGK